MSISDDMLEIFQPSLDTIERLMKDQIAQALLSSSKIDKIVLAGGFGDSPALKEHLSVALEKINRVRGTDMKLIFTPANTSAAGVATGAVMRSQNKENGPKRTPCQSIGVIRHVPWDEDLYEAEVLAQRGWEINELDQQDYIMRTIFWVIKVVNHSSLYINFVSC